MSFGARLLHTLVFSSIKWVADTWQNPPHRVRIIENSRAEQGSVRLRPRGKYREKPLGLDSVFKNWHILLHCWIFKLGLHLYQAAEQPPLQSGGGAHFCHSPYHSPLPLSAQPTSPTAAWPSRPAEFSAGLKGAPGALS